MPSCFRWCRAERALYRVTKCGGPKDPLLHRHDRPELRRGIGVKSGDVDDSVKACPSRHHDGLFSVSVGLFCKPKKKAHSTLAGARVLGWCALTAHP